MWIYFRMTTPWMCTQCCRRFGDNIAKTSAIKPTNTRRHDADAESTLTGTSAKLWKLQFIIKFAGNHATLIQVIKSSDLMKRAAVLVKQHCMVYRANQFSPRVTASGLEHSSWMPWAICTHQIRSLQRDTVLYSMTQENTEDSINRGPSGDSSKYSNELYGFIKIGEFLDS